MSQKRRYKPHDELPSEDVVMPLNTNYGVVLQFKRKGNLWFVRPEFDTYVYYTTTFWQPVTAPLPKN